MNETEARRAQGKADRLWDRAVVKADRQYKLVVAKAKCKRDDAKAKAARLWHATRAAIAAAEKGE